MMKTTTIDKIFKVKRRLSLRPGQFILLGFLVMILVGSFFLALPISSSSGQWMNFGDALFTSFSAVCVTGLTIVPTGSYFSGFGQVVLLLLVQIGGLGFMTATTLILLVMRKKISFKSRLTISDSLNLDSVKGVVKLVRSILILTLTTELIGSLILMPVFIKDHGAIGIWQAIFTSVSAFCNAGFDLFSSESTTSLYAYKSNPIVCLTVALLIIIGGLGFAVITDTISKRGQFRKLTLHSKCVWIMTAILTLFGTVFFLFSEYNNPNTIGGDNFWVSFLTSFFHSVSLRTAGFTTIDQNTLNVSSKVVSCILMFIGASPGSTGGGIKSTTFMLIIFTVINIVRGHDKVSVLKHSYNTKTILKAVSVMLLGLFTVLFMAIFLAIAEQNNQVLLNLELYHFENVLFESISAFSTTGLSTGIIPYLSSASKAALMFVMIFGRIGFINIAFAFFTDKKPDIIGYPEGNLLIG